MRLGNQLSRKPGAKQPNQKLPKKEINKKCSDGLNAHAFKHGKKARKPLEQQVVWTECKLK